MGTAEWFWRVFMLTGNINAYLGYRELVSNY
ncbi:YqzL family protein [Crassaminicella thermophila]|uniref:YqzL family protein n=1 Tax=Crassaminicella thermophila TaxID=2599308 RepID=A0A5C0SKC3_CRATE|nr:YqzL family protein [Crassaminicella thermophila]